MRIQLFDVDEMINLNKLKEISSPVLFERGGVPHPQGLVSNEIFGVNMRSRKETFAYIDLHGYFFNPHIYLVLKRLFRNIEKIVSGEQFYTISDEGELIRDDENGQTGVKFLYDNWDKLKWKKSKGMRNERINLITKSKKEEIFMSKQLVIPAFYRDIASSDGGGGKTIELNNMYTKLIRLSSLLDTEGMFDFSFNSANYNLQNIIVEIYNYFKGKLTGKNGLFRKYLLGKNTDNCVRTVISAPTFHANRPEDMMVNFLHCAVPIAQVCVLCYPFIFRWVKNFFEQEVILNQFNKPIFSKDNENVEYAKLVKPETYFDDRFIEKAINRFIKNPESRFERIKLPVEGDKDVYMRFMGRYCDPKNPTAESTSVFYRDITWTDILFLAAVDVTKDKYAIATRYPILDYFGMFINKVRVSSTAQTVPVEINGTIYKWYPQIDPKLDHATVATLFIDTLQFSNSYLTGLDGDYDGDQMTLKILWTQEANKEAGVIMMQKTNVLNVNGSGMRSIEHEAIQTLYILTKDPKKAA